MGTRLDQNLLEGVETSIEKRIDQDATDVAMRDDKEPLLPTNLKLIEKICYARGSRRETLTLGKVKLLGSFWMDRHSGRRERTLSGLPLQEP
jgi:hypothetical protein